MITNSIEDCKKEIKEGRDKESIVDEEYADYMFAQYQDDESYDCQSGGNKLED